jgi:endo-1,4-beta-xylanase
LIRPLTLPPALNEDGTYRESVWYNTIGEEFLVLAFKFASQVDPNVHLYYNDYNLEYNGAKTDGARRIVKLIQKAGVKINGVGFQAHLASESTPTSPGAAPSQQVLSTALRKMTSLGVDVAYTEIDVRMNTPPTKEKLRVQAKAHQRIAASCLAVPRCVGMTTWVSATATCRRG